MPYVITTRPGKADRCVLGAEPSSRMAATLAEAIYYSGGEAMRYGAKNPYMGYGRITEEGGTITLPDGTVIEVTRGGWPEIRGQFRARKT